MREIVSFEKAEIASALDGVSRARVGLIGDMCLDAYWTADMKKSELSRETPHFPLPVVAERYSPGAGGNAAANIRALEPQKLTVLSVLGDDWRGALLQRELGMRGIPTDNVIVSPDIITNAYIKPLRTGISDVVYEDPRLDFVNTRPLTRGCEDALIAALERAAASLDALCVSDQMAVGVVTDRVREKINELASAGLTVVVDSRDRIGLYRNAILKPNEVELSRATGIPADRYEEAARLLAQKTGADVLVTLGGSGCAYVSGDETRRFGAVPVTGEIDICGAGDTFLSAFTAVLAGGAGKETAIAAATLASSVTIRKIGQTGTAARGEIRAAFDRAMEGK
jgi:rfaE bifunctional protein kinase chain/domain